MFFSRDPNIQNMTQAFIEDERSFRHISIETETDTETQFLNWKDEVGQSGTASFINNARKAVKRLNVHLYLGSDESTCKTLIIGNSEIEINTNVPAKIGRFLTQRVIRPALAQKITQHPQKGSSFPTLRQNDCSNKALRNLFTQKSDAFFRFMVAARTNCLPTPANISIWYRDAQIENHCLHCNFDQTPTLPHILNGCHHNFPLMTDRHNRVVRCLRKVIERNLATDLIGEIHENTPLQVDGLSEELTRLRPDMWFVRRENHENTLEILEVSCPFGYLDEGVSSLKRSFDHKMDKYQHLANEVTALTRMTVKLHPIIVSSLGALYTDSMKCLKSLLKCKDKELRTLGSWMSDQAIMGSFKLWIGYQRTNVHHHQEIEEVRTEITISNQEEIDDLSNEDEPTDEEDEEEINNEENVSVTGESDSGTFPTPESEILDS
jgi:hypothetical protein